MDGGIQVPLGTIQDKGYNFLNGVAYLYCQSRYGVLVLRRSASSVLQLT